MRISWILRMGTLVGLVSAALVASAQFEAPAPLAWRWVQSNDVPPMGSPLVDGDRVYVAVGSRIYCLDKNTGNQIWRYPAGEPIAANFRQGLTKVGSNIVAAGDNKTFYACNAETGAAAWQYLSPVNPVGMPVSCDKWVVTALGDSSLMAIDGATGAQAWDKAVNVDSGLMGQIVGYRGNVIFFTQDYRIRCLDVSSKKDVWRNPGQFTSLAPDVSATVFGENVYICSGEFVIAISAQTGGSRWQTNVGETLVMAPGVSTEGLLAVSRDGFAYALNLRGKKIRGRGIDLESLPVANPFCFDNFGVVPTTNGSLNMIDLRTGDLVWSFVVKPITSFTKDKTNTGGGGESGGGPGGLSGPGAGRPGGGAAGGGTQAGGTTGDKGNAQLTYVTAVGPAVVSGSAMMVLCRDGSILNFDKKMGVDLTPPRLKMLFPNAGDPMSGQPPFDLVFTILDEASGVKADSIKIDIDGKPVAFTVDREGIIFAEFSTGGKNSGLTDGRKTITIEASDWMGNTIKQTYTLFIDNTLKALGRYPGLAKPKTGTSGSGGGGTLGGPGGGRGG